MWRLPVTKISKPGIYDNIPAADYFADPCPEPSLTQSLCKTLLAQSPLHAMHEHPKLAPPAADDEDAEKYVKAQAIGNAAHAILIGRGKQIAAAPFSDWKTKEARAFKAEQARIGNTPILERHLTAAHDIVRAARAQLDSAEWSDAFMDGSGEVVACWEEDGIWFRTMIDWLSPGRRFLYDLKTSGASFAPHIINRKMVEDGWDIQAAMHKRALDRLDPDGVGRRKFRFVAIENYPPYALVPVELTETWLTMGRKKLAMAIELWREAIKTGRFAGYPSEAVRPEYPGFMEAQWLSREIEHADRRLDPQVLNAG
jgi:hypothetical protein